MVTEVTEPVIRLVTRTTAVALAETVVQRHPVIEPRLLQAIPPQLSLREP